MNLFEIVELSTKELYLKVKHYLPEVTRITFELSRRGHTKQLYLDGFIHIGSKVETYGSIRELRYIISRAINRHKILFRRFN